MKILVNSRDACPASKMNKSLPRTDQANNFALQTRGLRALGFHCNINECQRSPAQGFVFAEN